MADYQAELQHWNVAKALTAADVDAALAGRPRVLLAGSANFLKGRPERCWRGSLWHASDASPP